MRLTLFLDHVCNLRCTYCYNGEKFIAPMPFQTAKAAVDMVLAAGHTLKQVGYFGGEPLMRLDLIKPVTQYIAERTADYEKPVIRVVTTNATLLTDDAVRWLGENDFHIGVSVDGCPEAHNACRVYADGRGSHKSVEAGVKRVMAGRLPLKSIAVIDPLNVALLPDSFDYLLGLGLKDVSMNVNYEADWNDGARELFAEVVEGLADRYIAAYRGGGGFKLNLLDSKIITHVKMGFSCADLCDFGCQEIAVSPSGKLYPCDRLIGEDTRDDVIIGTVFEGVDPVRRDALIANKNSVLNECADCDIVDRCMHWCGCVNYAMTGSVGDVSGLLCWFEQTIVHAADRAAETLYAEKDPAFVKRFYEKHLRK